ncbi:hypothetical protein [uncultured Oxalicibacterium sp.]|nr:hypothetical protein [uncultured Oxalicibacterium sp.]
MTNLTWPEIIVLGGTIFAVLYYVWINFISDLPDDFLDRHKRK